MTDTTISASDVENAIKAWAELKAYGAWAIVVIVAIVVGYFALRAWLDTRKEERIERRKDQRQRMYLAAINKLSTDIHEHMDNDAEAMDRITAAMYELRKTTNAILERQSGRLDVDPSLKVMEIFFSSIAVNAATIIGRSLDENDYEGRKSVVSAKVKTSLSRCIEEAMVGVRTVSLAFDPNFFFRTYEDPETGGLRYLLCDQMWNAVEDLFLRHSEPLRPRLEELRIILSNTVRDQYSHIARKFLENRIQALTPPNQTVHMKVPA